MHQTVLIQQLAVLSKLIQTKISGRCHHNDFIFLTTLRKKNIKYLRVNSFNILALLITELLTELEL